MDSEAQQMPAAAQSRPAYNTGVARGLAIAQLVLGAVCLVIGILLHALRIVPYAWYTGAIEIWTELFFIFAGGTGILASYIPSNSFAIIAHMVFSILSPIAAFVLFVEACLWVWHFYMFIPLLIMSFAEIVISITSAVFCCKALCCGGRSRQPPAVVYQPVPQKVSMEADDKHRPDGDKTAGDEEHATDDEQPSDHKEPSDQKEPSDHKQPSVHKPPSDNKEPSDGQPPPAYSETDEDEPRRQSQQTTV